MPLKSRLTSRTAAPLNDDASSPSTEAAFDPNVSPRRRLQRPPSPVLATPPVEPEPDPIDQAAQALGDAVASDEDDGYVVADEAPRTEAAPAENEAEAPKPRRGRRKASIPDDIATATDVDGLRALMRSLEDEIKAKHKEYLQATQPLTDKYKAAAGRLVELLALAGH